MAGMLACILCLALHTPALAMDDMVTCKETAQVQTDGSLHISQNRTYVMSQESTTLVWQLGGVEEDTKIEVGSIRMAHSTLQGGIEGDWTTFQEVPFASEMRGSDAASMMSAQQGASPQDGLTLPEGASFAVDAHRSAIYLFFPATSGRVTFDADITLTNMVRAFDDVAELYWDYLPVSEIPATGSVNATIQLPMPEGMEAVAGQNVFAWGHGAQGAVSIKEDGTISFKMPEVRAGQYGQAHVLFPTAWLSNLSVDARLAHSGTRGDAAKSEEAAWTDTWSAWLANSYALDMAFIIVGLLALGSALILYLAFGREGSRNVSKDDAPASEGGMEETAGLPEPAVMGRLLRWGHTSEMDLVATLTALMAKKAILADPSVSGQPMGKGYGNIRFKGAAKAKSLIETPAEQALFALLFDDWGDGYMSVSLSDIREKAGKDKAAFRHQIAEWSDVLTEEVRSQDLFDARSIKAQRAVLIGACILFAGVLLFGVMGGSFVRGTALALAAIGCALIGNYMKKRTQKGVAMSLSASVAAGEISSYESLDGMPDGLVPYAVELYPDGVLPNAQVAPITEDAARSSSMAEAWLSPRLGRGGKAYPSLARRLSRCLEEWG